MKSDKRYFIFKDGENVGSAATREQAILSIRFYQKYETHPILRANFSIIYGEQECIPYEKVKL